MMSNCHSNKTILSPAFVPVSALPSGRRQNRWMKSMTLCALASLYIRLFLVSESHQGHLYRLIHYQQQPLSCYLASITRRLAHYAGLLVTYPSPWSATSFVRYPYRHYCVPDCSQRTPTYDCD